LPIVGRGIFGRVLVVEGAGLLVVVGLGTVD
jgi:hypothetical protein